jgi:anti-sigma factor RsiW
MCDKELLLGYLYDDLAASERQAFDAHLATCVECRDELVGLRGTRVHLAAWAPPEPDLGFEIVRGPKPSPARGAWWRLSPAWGLAAAAMLTLGATAAIANLEVRVGAEGLVVRTGWSRPAAVSADQSAATVQTASAVQRVEARMKELEGQLAARQPATVTTANAANPNRMSDAEVARLVRQLVDESEQRQQGMLATKILQVNRDIEAARRNDVDRLLTAYRQLQGASYETSQRQRALEDHLVRVGLQR